jgi:hypothetical protein
MSHCTSCAQAEPPQNSASGKPAFSCAIRAVPLRGSRRPRWWTEATSQRTQLHGRPHLHPARGLGSARRRTSARPRIHVPLHTRRRIGLVEVADGGNMSGWALAALAPVAAYSGSEAGVRGAGIPRVDCRYTVCAWRQCFSGCSGEHCRFWLVEMVGGGNVLRCLAALAPGRVFSRITGDPQSCQLILEDSADPTSKAKYASGQQQPVRPSSH